MDTAKEDREDLEADLREWQIMQEFSLTEKDLFPPYKSIDLLPQIDEILLIRLRKSINKLKRLNDFMPKFIKE